MGVSQDSKCPLSRGWGYISTLHCPMQCFNASLEGKPWRLYHFVRHF